MLKRYSRASNHYKVNNNSIYLEKKIIQHIWYFLSQKINTGYLLWKKKYRRSTKIIGYLLIWSTLSLYLSIFMVWIFFFSNLNDWKFKTHNYNHIILSFTLYLYNNNDFHYLHYSLYLKNLNKTLIIY